MDDNGLSYQPNCHHCSELSHYQRSVITVSIGDKLKSPSCRGDIECTTQLTSKRSTSTSNKTMASNGGDSAASCPICFTSSDDDDEEVARVTYAKTKKCGHVFCLACIQQVLQKPSVQTHNDPTNQQDEESIYLEFPTWGRCPMCRTATSLFDLLDASDESSYVVPKNRNVSSWAMIAGSVYEQRQLGRSSSEEMEPMMLEVINRLGATSGYGLKFYFEDVVPSLTFPSPQEVSSTNFNDYHFHEESMTFYGCIRFDPPLKEKESSSTNTSMTFVELNCGLQFSDNGQYIRRGVLSWKYEPTSSEMYPLDGRWTMYFVGGTITSVHIQRHQFHCFGERYSIATDQNNCPWVEWPENSSAETEERIRQVCTKQILPGAIGSEVADVGETLEWNLSIAINGQSTIVWERLATTLENATKVVKMKPGQFVYRRINRDPNSNDQEALGPSYHATTLWGNTFCQGYTVGLASYHFLSEPDEDGSHRAYISYENPQTFQWPPLDNGSTVPSRVPFRNIEWNTETRTFKGEIHWLDDFGTTWTNDSLWEYEIVFDPTFKFILSGTCSRSDEREPHRFGHDLVYVNAALEDALREVRANTQSTGRYLDVIRSWRQEGASDLTLSCLGDVAMAVLDNADGSLFDFNI